MSAWFRTYGFGEMFDGLIVGAYPLDASDVSMLQMMGVRRVLNLVEDEEYGAGERGAVEAAYREAGIVEERIKLTDFAGLPTEQLEQAVVQVNAWLDDELPVYVHCRAGWQRSATVAAGVVALRLGLDVEDALAFIKAAKPTAEPLAHQRAGLHEWFDGRSGPPAADD